MSQGYIAETKGDYDARWVGPSGNFLIEVKSVDSFPKLNHFESHSR